MFIDLSREDGWMIGFERLLTGGLLMKFYEPKNKCSSILSVSCPAGTNEEVYLFACRMMMGDYYMGISEFVSLDKETIAGVLFNNHEPEEQRDYFYRFRYKGQYGRIG